MKQHLLGDVRRNTVRLDSLDSIEKVVTHSTDLIRAKKGRVRTQETPKGRCTISSWVNKNECSNIPPTELVLWCLSPKKKCPSCEYDKG